MATCISGYDNYGSRIRSSSVVQPIRHAPFVSHRERAVRDVLMLEVRKSICSKRLDASQILLSGRPINTAVRARILRDEHDEFSLKRAIQLADATGVDNVTLFRALCVELAPETPVKPQDLPRIAFLFEPADA